MKKTERKRPSAYKALRTRIAALGLSLWFTSMILITWAAAADMYNQIAYHASRDVHTQYGAQDLPGSEEYRMLLNISDGYRIYLSTGFPFMLDQMPDTYSSSDWFWDETELLYGYEPAMIIRDQAGDILMQTGDYLFFQYTTTAYGPDDEKPAAHGYGYIDLNAPGVEMKTLKDFVYEHRSGGSIDQLVFYHFRMTGWFEGGRFYPVSVSYNYPGLETKQLFYGTAEPGKELVTIYMEHAWVCTRPTTSVSVGGTRFDSLTDLLDAHSSQQGNYRSDNLFNAVIIVSSHSTEKNVYLAYRCCPVGYAALRLIPFYLISFALVVLCVYLILRGIRKNLTEPLSGILLAATINAPLAPGTRWKEVRALETLYADTRQTLAETNTEVQQLRTALEYAENAEKNRRELISGITHELKTPLAVIHSYAEGLQAGIAEDKKDRYLSVILEESERMDSIVLELLDLSRLEAGKVRLSMDTFSLLALTRSVAEKFTPLLEARGLTIDFPIAEDFPIIADESRMEQVITNLISNAVKYTPDGGSIQIQVFRNKGTVHFSINNPSPPLSEEQLQKIWDSFYRADPSRTAPGTGLGLALVKSIISLHQGSCVARNISYRSAERVDTGVEFRFTLPGK